MYTLDLTKDGASAMWETLTTQSDLVKGRSASRKHAQLRRALQEGACDLTTKSCEHCGNSEGTWKFTGGKVVIPSKASMEFLGELIDAAVQNPIKIPGAPSSGTNITRNSVGYDNLSSEYEQFENEDGDVVDVGEGEKVVKIKEA